MIRSRRARQLAPRVRAAATALLIRRLPWLFLLVHLALPGRVQATIEPVTIRVPQSTAWVGQRVAFFVELRAAGSFAGSAGFELPRIPGAILLKIGSPVVGSEEVDGTTWFVQSHEFALYSQRQGPLTVPPIAVRFSHRQGFTGPAVEASAASPAWEVVVERPPGSSDRGFLVTTEALEVSESWDPPPGPATVGAVFVRTIEQRATEVPGMALAPAAQTAPDGVRLYAREPATVDHLDRGEFLGARTDTITYLLQSAGTFELPSLTYTWWNPRTQSLDSHTLPAVRIDVSAPPANAAIRGIDTRLATALLALALTALVLRWQRHRLASAGRRIHHRLWPPDRQAARQLLRACRRDQAEAAQQAWTVWRSLQAADLDLGTDLQTALGELQRCLYGRDADRTWHGAPLAQAFRRLRPGRPPAGPMADDSHLPNLNFDA